jgi:hypothetical protein
MLPTAYKDACTTKFKFHELFLAVLFLRIEKLLRDSDGMDVPTQNKSLTRDIPSFGMLVGLLLLLC